MSKKNNLIKNKEQHSLNITREKERKEKLEKRRLARSKKKTVGKTGKNLKRRLKEVRKQGKNENMLVEDK